MQSSTLGAEKAAVEALMAASRTKCCSKVGRTGSPHPSAITDSLWGRTLLDAEATVIRVMADYECFPLWIRGSQTVENLDPVDLPITRGLTDQLLQWADAYDRTLNRDDPAASGFPSEEDEERFYRGGEELARELARQLSGSHQVEYFDGRTGRTTLVTAQGAS